MVKSIQNSEELLQTVKYIVSQTSGMAQEIVGRDFPIKSLTVFSHSPEEFELLCKILESLGKPYNYNNGPRVELYKPIESGTNRITHLRIRKPDPDRPEVGCNDFETDFDSFKNKYLLDHPANLSLIRRLEYDMIELHNPGFNVLAYVVSK
jgi:hypothetical protein